MTVSLIPRASCGCVCESALLARFFSRGFGQKGVTFRFLDNVS
jgi:hypothetical protein